MDTKDSLDDIDKKSIDVWNNIKNYNDLKEMFKGIILNKYKSPWYLGLFYNDIETDNPYLTDEFVKKFAELQDLNFLTNDSQMEVYEIKNNKAYFQKAFIVGWIPSEISDEFVDTMNSIPNIISFYIDLPNNKNLNKYKLSIGITGYYDIDSKTNKRLYNSVNLYSRYTLLKEKYSGIYNWDNHKNIKGIFSKLKHVIIINTNYLDKRGALLDLTIKILKELAIDCIKIE